MDNTIYAWLKKEAIQENYHSRKLKEFQKIEDEIKSMRNNNGQIFMGGYTEHAKQSYDAQEANIARIEKQRKEDHAKKWDGSEDSLKAFRKLLIDEQKALSGHYTINSPGAPRVGGSAGQHAAIHGGGFNHPGVYAGGVW